MKELLVCILGSMAWAAVAAAQAPVVTVASARLTLVVAGHPVSVPYYANMSLGGPHPQVERAAVLVHGSSRNGDTAYENLVDAALIAGVATGSALLVAPQFLIEADVTFHALGSDVLFWSDSGWKQGDPSLDTPGHPRPVEVSSFAVMDTILCRIAAANPNLREIVLGGHSAGAQFVQRYAALNRVEPGFTSGVEMSYVVANPSSYLYLDPKRAVAGSSTSFATPPPAVVQSCSYYDDYKYGLQDPNPYMAALPPSQIRSQFAARHVGYLLGELDTDPNDPALDQSCAAALQGAHRLQRGVIYGNYLGHLFGAAVLARHRVVVIPGVGHSSSGMFGSECGASLLMGGRYCSPSAGTLPDATAAWRWSCPNPFRVPSTVGFEVGTSGAPVWLRVHDVRGRVVRTLVEGPQPAGLRSVVWDGRSDGGEALPSGIYVFLLRQDGRTLAKKVALLR